MGKVIEHRGPDQGAVFQDGPIGLVARRLRIIDLSPAGSQPIPNEDGTIQLVYNGEMFNHEGLRQELQALGHRFRGRCDSEVVVHAYEAWGPRCVERFRGFFAFALWDSVRGELLLARDRIGIKPLYYAWSGDRLVFGSEIKAILEHPDVPRAMDLQSMYHYLGYEFVPGPATMFQGIRKLPPGTIARVRGGRLEIEPYWELRFEDAPDDAATLARRVRETLRDSVHAWMMSDVPEGVFLSGGLDSTAVLAFTREATTGPLPTFTLGYDDPSFSEWEYAREAARYYGTEHREIRVPPITPDVIEQTVWHLDEPMTDLSAVPLFLLCREARRDVTVCMSGEGGDEVFVGYDRFIASKAERFYRMLPRALRRGVIEPLVTRLPDQEQKKGPVVVLRRFIEGARLDPDGAPHALAVLRLGRPRRASLPGDRAALGRPGPLRADPPGGRALQLAPAARPRDLRGHPVHDAGLGADEGRQDVDGARARDPGAAARPPPDRAGRHDPAAAEVPGVPDPRDLPAGARGRAARRRSSSAASRATASRSSSGSGTSSATTWCSCSGAPRWCARTWTRRASRR